jgi:hypothetical protein
VSWINGNWNIPNIVLPLWVNPPIGPTVMNAVYNAIDTGMAASIWVGIQDSTGVLVQAGINAVIPDYDDTDVSGSSSAGPGSNGFTSVYYPFIDWVIPSNPGAIGVQLPSGCSLQPGDTMQVYIQVLDPDPPEPFTAPLTPSYTTVMFYFANITQDWAIVFDVTSDDVGAPLLGRSRFASWVVEQPVVTWPDAPGSQTPGPPGYNAGPNSQPPISGAVACVPRYGTVCFSNAVCGSWTGADYGQPLCFEPPPLSQMEANGVAQNIPYYPSGDFPTSTPIGVPPTLPIGLNGYAESVILGDGQIEVTSGTGTIDAIVAASPSAQVTVPAPQAEGLFPVGGLPVGGLLAVPSWIQPLIIVDTMWNYYVQQVPPHNAQPEPLPPAGPVEQALYPTRLLVYQGTPVSVGQLIDRDTVMCKYVYPPG